MLSMVGLLAVFVLPLGCRAGECRGLLRRKIRGSFSNGGSGEFPPLQAEAITTDRLLASTDASDTEAHEADNDVSSPNMEFPSGDGVEQGTAPLAPSTPSRRRLPLDRARARARRSLIPNVPASCLPSAMCVSVKARDA